MIVDPPAESPFVDAPWDTLWQVADHAPLLWERFETGSLIFNPLSGTTHLLFDPVPDLLELLTEQPRNISQLIAALDLQEEIPLEGLKGRVGQMLNNLDRLGLIHPARIDGKS